MLPMGFGRPKVVNHVHGKLENQPFVEDVSIAMIFQIFQLFMVHVTVYWHMLLHVFFQIYNGFWSAL